MKPPIMKMNTCQQWKLQSLTSLEPFLHKFCLKSQHFLLDILPKQENPWWSFSLQRKFMWITLYLYPVLKIVDKP